MNFVRYAVASAVLALMGGTTAVYAYRSVADPMTRDVFVASIAMITIAVIIAAPIIAGRKPGRDMVGMR